MNRVDGKLARMIAIIDVIGLAKIAPGMPHKVAQTDSDTMTTSGLRFSCLPTIRGSMKLPTVICAAVSNIPNTAVDCRESNCASDNITDRKSVV